MAVGSLLVAACGGDDDAATASSASASASASTDDRGTAAPATGDAADECTEDRVGGQVTIGQLVDPQGLDPVVNRGTGNTGGNEILPLYDSLLRYDPATDEFVPMVAESLEPNADFTAWTLKLRDGVTFGNGDPLTAEAVRASFARHQDPANKSANYLESQAVTEMEVVDPLTLVFHLDAPWSRFPSLLAHVAGMITNPAVVDARGDQFNADPTGAGVGPYELERWAPGEELVLKAKADWWGGPVCIQQLRFVVISGGAATYDAFRTGEIQAAMLREADTVAQTHDDGVEGISTFENAGTTFALNHVSGPASDLLVRQALAAAIDPEVINDRAFGGAGLPTTAVVAEQSAHYDGLEGPQPDAARAAELVQQAKAAGWDGNIELLCQAIPAGTDVCLAAKAMADAAGMNMTVVSKPPNEIAALVRNERNFQMARIGSPVDDGEPWMRLSASLGTGGALNSGGYSNAEMDAALDALRSAPDEAARKRALAEIQDIWNETIPSIIYETTEARFVLADEVKGVLPSQTGQIHFDKAYIDD